MTMATHNVAVFTLWPPLNRTLKNGYSGKCYGCVSVCSVASVMSASLRPYGLYSPPDSSVHGILQARILEWVATPFSRGSSWPRDRTHVSCVSCSCRWILYSLSHLGSPNVMYISPQLTKEHIEKWKEEKELSNCEKTWRYLNCTFAS